MTDWDNYDSAVLYAASMATISRRDSQLRRVREYGRAVYRVTFATLPSHRFGVDGEGEFFTPDGLPLAILMRGREVPT